MSFPSPTRASGGCRARRARRGVTLLEVIVSAAILAIGLAGAMEAIARCAASTRQAQDRGAALLVARSKMDEILKEPVLTIGTDRGQGVDETTNYDWAVAIEESPNPDLYVVRVEARHRVTNTWVRLDTLRRPDLTLTPAGTPAVEPGTETTPTTTATGGSL